MGESLLLITVITLIVLTIRRARPVVLDSSVMIQRPGQYHIILAPQLNRAQTFIEQIAKQFLKIHTPHGDIPSQYYEVRDPGVFAQGQNSYLLAATLRGGLLYFQAVNPRASQHDASSHLNTLREFSESVLKPHPHVEPSDEQGAEKLGAAVEIIAKQLKIEIQALV